jgi:antitoxin CcdA
MRIRNAHPNIMQAEHNSPSSKRAANLTLSTEVLADAKALGINISKACDLHLRELVRKEKEARWKAEHADFIQAYNQTVAEESLPLDAWRTF